MKRFLAGQRVLIYLLTLLQVFFLFGSASAGSSLPSFYYFNPDSSHSNLARLKQAMDQLLNGGKTSFSFQPFVHQSDLDKIISENPPAFVFVPEWYLKAYGKEKGLRPILVPTKNSATTYRKVFLASNNLINLKQCSLAMTNMGPKPETTLNSLGFTKKGIDPAKLNIVTVPKDLDALFALALGQVDCALVSRENIDLAAASNPNIKNTMREIFVSDMIPMPILCAVEGKASPEEVKKFKELFLNQALKEIRKPVMEMLQIDEWKDAAN